MALYSEAQEKKFLLKQVQPPTFKGEGKDVERDAEIWMEAMDDYFKNARTSRANCAMLGALKLVGDAKLWWKQHCRDNDVEEDSQDWEKIKNAVTERYLPPAHRALKMNEFFDLRQDTLTLEGYYSRFVTLRRYAPRLSLDEQVTRFCQGLNAPLDTRLEAMRPSSLQDALIRAKPLVKEQQRQKENRSRFNSRSNYRGRGNNHPNFSQRQPRMQARAANARNQYMENIQCFECNEWGHYRSSCPKLARREATLNNNNLRTERNARNPQGNQDEGQGRGQGRGRGRGRGRAAGARGRGRGQVSHVRIVEEPTLEDETYDRATVHAAIDNPDS